MTCLRDLMKTSVLYAAIAALTVCTTHAAPPEWWGKHATRVLEPSVTADNYAPANLGQLKLLSKKAMYHMEIGLYLQGGAGPSVRGVVEGFKPQSGVTYTPTELEEIMAANYAPVNLGQLKAVSKVFYDRLMEEEVGFDTKQNLITRGYPLSWAFDYPWDPSTPISENYAPANLGQLKMVFSFDLGSPNGTDTDGDGMSDAYELANGFDPNDGDENNNGIPDGLEDPDGDAVASMGEELQGRNPNAGATNDTTGQLGLIVYTQLEQ